MAAPGKISEERVRDLILICQTYVYAEQVRIEARNEVVVANLGLSKFFFRLGESSGLDRDDVVDHVAVGLMDTTENFDLSRDTKFSTYACWRIRKQIGRACFLARRDRSRFFRGNGELNDERLDRIADHRDAVSSIDDRDSSVADSRAVRRVMASWSPDRVWRRYAIVLAMRYGISGYRPMSLSEVANHFGFSKQRARQIEERAKERFATDYAHYRETGHFPEKMRKNHARTHAANRTENHVLDGALA